MESFKSNTKISIERNGKKYDDVNIRYDQTLNYKKKQIKMLAEIDNDKDNLISIYSFLDKKSITFKSEQINDKAIVLENNGNKFNFILDTGANSCLLSSKVLNKIECKELGSAGTARGISGDQVVTNKVEATFKYENINITEIFQVFEVASFEVLEAQYGIEIAGILGYNFLRGHEFVMDLKELITYTK